MQFSKHFYAIAGLVVLLTAMSVGSNRAQTKGSATSVLVTNSSIPVTLSSSSAALKIANSKSDPVLVRDVDVAARVHVEGSASGGEQTANTVEISVYQVPAGKRFVLQGLCIRAGGPEDPGVSGMSFHNGSNLFFMEVRPQGKNAFNDSIYVGALDMPVEAAGGSELKVYVNRRNLTYGISANVTFTGYLVSEPIPAP